MIGAIATACWVPRGSVTGKAEPSRVSTVQNAIPSRTWVPVGLAVRWVDAPTAMPGSTGITRVVSHERNSAQCHDSSDVELQGPRHRLPVRWSTTPELYPLGRTVGYWNQRTRSP